MSLGLTVAFEKTDVEGRFVRGWARWNYTGYEGKDAYPEYRDLVLTMAGLLAGIMLPLMFLMFQRASYRAQVQNQLPDAFFLLSRSLRAGLNLEQAMGTVATYGTQPLAGELTCKKLAVTGLRACSVLWTNRCVVPGRWCTKRYRADALNGCCHGTVMGNWCLANRSGTIAA